MCLPTPKYLEISRQARELYFFFLSRFQSEGSHMPPCSSLPGCHSITSISWMAGAGLGVGQPTLASSTPVLGSPCLTLALLHPVTPHNTAVFYALLKPILLFPNLSIPPFLCLPGNFATHPSELNSNFIPAKSSPHTPEGLGKVFFLSQASCTLCST